MKKVPIVGLLGIVLGIIIFLQPNLLTYLVPLYLVASGVIKILDKAK